MAKKQNQPDCRTELISAYSRWKHLYKFGGQDPFWEDGCNMNLVRNHIIYYKKEIEKYYTPEEYPAEYYSPLPPKVDYKFMARKNEILENAKKSLEIYKSNSNYIELVKIQNSELLTKKEKTNCNITNVVNYATSLEKSIKDLSYVDMRRHENPERYLSSFNDCLKRVNEIINSRDTESNYKLYDEYDEQEDEEEFEL